MNKLYIHIGTGKTGTSALQSFMKRNRVALSECFGINYALSGIDGAQHSYLSANSSIYKRGGASLDELPSFWEKLALEIKSSSCTAHIISSESFPDIKEEDVKNICNWMDGVADLKVICYVRRQDLYLESWYAQLIKAGRTKANIEDLKSQLIKTNLLNHHYQAKKWSDCIGQSSIHLRAYEKSQFHNGNLFDDFMSILGVSNSNNLSRDNLSANDSLTRPQIEIIKMLESKGLAEALGERLTRPHVIFNGCDKAFLSKDQRKQLLDICSEWNELAAKEFLGREDGILFDDRNIDFERVEVSTDAKLEFLRYALSQI